MAVDLFSFERKKEISREHRAAVLPEALDPA
jgi:hypothetical protein